jgi:PKD repeat protein
LEVPNSFFSLTNITYIYSLVSSFFFALGALFGFSSVVVRWPPGNNDVICNPDKNTVLHIIENAAPVATAVFSANTTNIDEFESVDFTDASTPCPIAWNWSVNPTAGWNFSN